MHITMPRGDIRPVSFTVASISGETTDFDEIYFTVKKTYSDIDFAFQKRLSSGQIEPQPDGSYYFVIEPEDTDDLKTGTYVFDIEVVSGIDIKQTFIGTLTLTNEVTRAVNEVRLWPTITH